MSDPVLTPPTTGPLAVLQPAQQVLTPVASDPGALLGAQIEAMVAALQGATQASHQLAGMATNVNAAPTTGEVLTFTKSVLASRTIWALAVTAVATVAKQFGHPIGTEDQATLIDGLLNLVQYGGLIGAVIFRVLAKHSLT